MAQGYGAWGSQETSSARLEMLGPVPWDVPVQACRVLYGVSEAI